MWFKGMKFGPVIYSVFLVCPRKADAIAREKTTPNTSTGERGHGPKRKEHELTRWCREDMHEKGK